MLDALGNIGDFLGGLGVVATLVYLALQIRQNTRQLDHNSELVLASSEIETARLISDWHRTVAESPEFVRLWDHLAEPEVLTDDERGRLLWLIAQYLDIAQGLYRQHQRGFLPTESWRPHERGIAGILQLPWIREWFDTRTTLLSDDFFLLCTGLAETPPAPDTWRHAPTSQFGATKPAV